MKFVCSKCSQKHTVAKSLLLGKKIVRVKCQRCGQRITLRAMTKAMTKAMTSRALGTDDDSILFSWKTFANRPVGRLRALPPAPPMPPLVTAESLMAAAELATPPKLPTPPVPLLAMLPLVSAESLMAAAAVPPPPLPPELPPEASQPVGVTSGIVDMLALAQGYFAQDDDAAAVDSEPAAAEPDFAQFAPSAYDRTMEIVLPPTPAPSRARWNYIVAAGVGAAVAVAATLAMLVWEQPDAAEFAAADQPHSRHFDVATDLGAPMPASDEFSEFTNASEPPSSGVADPTEDDDAPQRLKPKRITRRVTPTVTVRRTPRTPVKPRAKVKQHVVWDEVECMLAENPPKACAPFIKRVQPIKLTANTTEASVHTNLSRNLINAGMTKVRWRVDQCGTRGWGAGQVTVTLKVNKQGVVTSSLIASAPNSNLAACVKERVLMARFAKTQTGGSFSYLFSFR